VGAALDPRQYDGVDPGQQVGDLGMVPEGAAWIQPDALSAPASVSTARFAYLNHASSPTLKTTAIARIDCARRRAPPSMARSTPSPNQPLSAIEATSTTTIQPAPQA
jgi:hypothetical protein